MERVRTWKTNEGVFLAKYSLELSGDPVVREMWLLMDLDDSGLLTLRELARGVPTITQVSKVIYGQSMYF